MKKLLNLSLLALLLMGLFVGCEKDEDEDDPIDEFMVLVEYLEAGDNYVNNLGSWIVNYADITLADYFILDIRSEAHFTDTANEYDLDHLENAVNATMTTMFDAVDGASLPILVVCYSGQSASYAHMLLQLAGHDAYVLKWGMSAVAAEHDKWTGNVSNDYAAHVNWSHDAAPDLPDNDYPELATGLETGEEILAARITAAAAAGFVGHTAETVMDDPTLYNIINYWALTDYDNYGHIVGAFQVDPASLTLDGNLSVFSADTQNLLYCWTGQTAAATAAYLTVIGYDVIDLKFGVNSMIFDELTAHKWPMPW